jgi:hypothetical protein
MGFFFDGPKPRVTAEEWKKIRGSLYDLHHFTTIELNKAEEIFRGDMSEQKILDCGIDTFEVVKGIQWMREHLNAHHIPMEKINALEMEMMKYVAK